MRSPLTLLACAAVVIAVAVGCGGKETYSTPEGPVTVEETGAKPDVTFEGDRGKIEIREGEAPVELGRAATEEEIGIPFYPGAKAEYAAARSQEGEETTGLRHIMLTTPDPVDKVKTFYKENLPDAEEEVDITTPELQMTQLVLEEDDVQKVVLIQRGGGENATKIILNRMEKSD